MLGLGRGGDVGVGEERGSGHGVPAGPGPFERSHILDALGHAVVALGLDGRVTYWNREAEELFGWPPVDAVGQDALDMLVPPFNAERGAEILEAIGNGKTWHGTFGVQRKDGVTFNAVASGSPVLDEQRVLIGIVGVLTDLAPFLRPFLSQSSEAAVITGSDGTVMFASPAVKQVLDWSEEGLPGFSLLELTHHEDRAAVQAQLRGLLEGAGGQPFDFRIETPEETWRWVQAVLTDLLSDPGVRGIVWTLRDTSERHSALEQLTEVALHDALTGLPNRVLLTDRVAQASSRRDAHGAVLFIDLDDFKGVNDGLGHAAGDTLLKAVADRLSHAIRPEDTCGRWSGDEFLVVNESIADLDQANVLAERISAVLAEPVHIAGHALSVTCSIGVALLSDGADPEEILRLADERMYDVKRRHRASVPNSP